MRIVSKLGCIAVLTTVSLAKTIEYSRVSMTYRPSGIVFSILPQIGLTAQVCVATNEEIEKYNTIPCKNALPSAVPAELR
jgi:hypothetical protein